MELAEVVDMDEDIVGRDLAFEEKHSRSVGGVDQHRAAGADAVHANAPPVWVPPTFKEGKHAKLEVADMSHEESLLEKVKSLTTMEDIVAHRIHLEQEARKRRIALKLQASQQRRDRFGTWVDHLKDRTGELYGAASRLHAAVPSLLGVAMHRFGNVLTSLPVRAEGVGRALRVYDVLRRKKSRIGEPQRDVNGNRIHQRPESVSIEGPAYSAVMTVGSKGFVCLYGILPSMETPWAVPSDVSSAESRLSGMQNSETMAPLGGRDSTASSTRVGVEGAPQVERNVESPAVGDVGFLGPRRYRRTGAKSVLHMDVHEFLESRRGNLEGIVGSRAAGRTLGNDTAGGSVHNGSTLSRGDAASQHAASQPDLSAQCMDLANVLGFSGEVRTTMDADPVVHGSPYGAWSTETSRLRSTRVDKGPVTWQPDQVDLKLVTVTSACWIRCEADDVAESESLQDLPRVDPLASIRLLCCTKQGLGFLSSVFVFPGKPLSIKLAAIVTCKLHNARVTSCVASLDYRVVFSASENVSEGICGWSTRNLEKLFVVPLAGGVPALSLPCIRHTYLVASESEAMERGWMSLMGALDSGYRHVECTWYESVDTEEAVRGETGRFVDSRRDDDRLGGVGGSGFMQSRDDVVDEPCWMHWSDLYCQEMEHRNQVIYLGSGSHVTSLCFDSGGCCLMAAFCNGEIVRVEIDPVLVYRDDSHGSNVTELLSPVVDDASIPSMREEGVGQWAHDPDSSVAAMLPQMSSIRANTTTTELVRVCGMPMPVALALFCLLRGEISENINAAENRVKFVGAGPSNSSFTRLPRQRGHHSLSWVPSEFRAGCIAASCLYANSHTVQDTLFVPYPSLAGMTDCDDSKRDEVLGRQLRNVADGDGTFADIHAIAASVKSFRLRPFLVAQISALRPSQLNTLWKNPAILPQPRRHDSMGQRTESVARNLFGCINAEPPTVHGGGPLAVATVSQQALQAEENGDKLIDSCGAEMNLAVMAGDAVFVAADSRAERRAQVRRGSAPKPMVIPSVEVSPDASRLTVGNAGKRAPAMKSQRALSSRGGFDGDSDDEIDVRFPVVIEIDDADVSSLATGIGITSAASTIISPEIDMEKHIKCGVTDGRALGSPTFRRIASGARVSGFTSNRSGPKTLGVPTSTMRVAERVERDRVNQVLQQYMAMVVGLGDGTARVVYIDGSAHKEGNRLVLVDATGATEVPTKSANRAANERKLHQGDGDKSTSAARDRMSWLGEADGDSVVDDALVSPRRSPVVSGRGFLVAAAISRAENEDHWCRDTGATWLASHLEHVLTSPCYYAAVLVDPDRPVLMNTSIERPPVCNVGVIHTFFELFEGVSHDYDATESPFSLERSVVAQNVAGGARGRAILANRIAASCGAHALSHQFFVLGSSAGDVGLWDSASGLRLAALQQVDSSFVSTMEMLRGGAKDPATDSPPVAQRDDQSEVVGLEITKTRHIRDTMKALLGEDADNRLPAITVSMCPTSSMLMAAGMDRWTFYDLRPLFVWYIQMAHAAISAGSDQKEEDVVIKFKDEVQPLGRRDGIVKALVPILAAIRCDAPD